MAGQHEAVIKIKAQVDDAEKNLKKLEARVKNLAEKQSNSTKATQDSSKATVDYVAKVGLAANAIVSLVGQLETYVKRAVDVSNVQRSLKFSVDGAAAAVGHQTDKLTLAKSANKLYATGLVTTEKQMAQLMGATAKLSDAMGEDLDASIKKVTDSLITGEIAELKSLGITNEATRLRKEYADSIGVSTDALTGAEKSQIAMNEILRQAEEKSEKLSGATETLATRMMALRNQFKDTVDTALTLDRHIGELAEEIDDYFMINAAERHEIVHNSWRTFVGIITLGNSEMIRLGMNTGRVMDDVAGFIAAQQVATRGLPGSEERQAQREAHQAQQEIEAERERNRMIQEREGGGAAGRAEAARQASRRRRGGGRGGRRAEVTTAGDFDLSVDLSGAARDNAGLLRDDEGDIQRAQQALEVYQAQSDAQAARLDRAGDVEAAARFEIESMQERHRLEADLLAQQRERAEWEAENALEEGERREAKMELERIAHEERMMQIEQLNEAEDRFAAQEHRRHEAHRKRFAERREAAGKAMQVTQQTSSGIMQALALENQAQVERMRAAGASEEAIAAKQNEGAEQQKRWRVATLVMDGVFYTGRAIAAAAALNPFDAAANFAGAAISFSQAGSLANAPIGAGAGGASRGGSIVTAPRGAQRGGPRMADSNIPQSSDASRQERESSGGTVININGMALGTPEDIGREVDKVLRAHKRAGGMQ